MKNFLIKKVSILLMLALTACGGSGSGSGGASPSPENPASSLNPSPEREGQLFVAKNGRYSLYYPDTWTVFVNLGNPGEIDDTVVFHPSDNSSDITVSEKTETGPTIESLKSRWNSFGYTTSLGNVGDYPYVIAKKSSQIITSALIQLLLPSETDQNRILTFEIPTVDDSDIFQLESVVATVVADRKATVPESYVLTVLADGVPLAGTLSQGGVWQFNLNVTPNAIVTLSVDLEPDALSQAVTLNEFRPDAVIKVLSNNRVQFIPEESSSGKVSIDSLGYGIPLGDITINRNDIN